MKKYYVYTHCHPNGKVFYVGKGTGRRAWAKRKGKAWQNPYGIEILFNDLTEREALDLECMLIESYGIENLVNKKRERVSDSTKSLAEYKLWQHAKDLIWLNENIDKIDYKNPFIKEQIEILEWSMNLHAQLQKEYPVLNR